MRIILSILLIALSVGAIALAGAMESATERLSITIDRIVDGDTVRATGSDGKPYTIRLAAIDAPEKAQEWGKESTDALKAKSLGKTGALTLVDVDKYGRTVGIITLDDNSLNLNYWMVATGNAHWYEKYAKWMDKPQAAKFGAAYEDARRQKVGLWNAKKMELPEDHRKAKRQG